MRTPSTRLASTGAIALGVLSTSLFALGSGDDVPGVGEIGGPARQLDAMEMERWLAGRELFDKNFHKSEGLGAPELNADSCRACHQDPILGGAGGLELNVSRFGFDNGGQGPFQDLTGGQGLSKFYPPWEDGREEYDPAEADVFEQRQTPPVFGAGLIDAIPDAEILANEDPQDLDGDGIRGVARRITMPNQSVEIGRFGWKAQVPRIGDFSQDAMAGECGITTPDDGRGFGMFNDGDAVADPELSQADLDDLTFFMRLLGAPPRGGSTDPKVALGEDIFESIGCAQCHVPTLNGVAEPAHLYSDLLLHNVMPADYRGMSEPGAGPGWFRTTPLWGVKDTAPYLHDGRAETLGDAIRMHAGEASRSVFAYQVLDRDLREALILFLEDL